MIALGFAVMWAGYQQVIFGWTLLKGWDIRWRDLANPIHPYQWPALGQSMPMIPAGQVMPGGTSAPAAATTASPGKPPSAPSGTGPVM